MSEKFPAKITIGEKYGPAMEITEQQAADDYFLKCVTHAMKYGGHGREKAEEIERTNLGYFAGYYDSTTRERVERLFKCAHPFFGPIAVNGTPTPETAMNIGRAIGGGRR